MKVLGRVLPFLHDKATRYPARFTLTCSGVVFAATLFVIQYTYNKQLDETCERLSEKSQAIVDIGSVLGAPTPIRPGDDEAAVRRIEGSNANKQKTREIISALSAPDACADGVLPPSRAGEYQLEPD